MMPTTGPFANPNVYFFPELWTAYRGSDSKSRRRNGVILDSKTRTPFLASLEAGEIFGELPQKRMTIMLNKKLNKWGNVC